MSNIYRELRALGRCATQDHSRCSIGFSGTRNASILLFEVSAVVQALYRRKDARLLQTQHLVF